MHIVIREKTNNEGKTGTIRIDPHYPNTFELYITEYGKTLYKNYYHSEKNANQAMYRQLKK